MGREKEEGAESGSLCPRSQKKKKKPETTSSEKARGRGSGGEGSEGGRRRAAQDSTLTLRNSLEKSGPAANPKGKEVAEREQRRGGEGRAA